MTAPDRPNVIVVVFDTARLDAFAPYGAAAGATPAASQLASVGRAFSDVYATSNWTLPSHVSMLTGLLPRTAGLSTLPGGRHENCRAVMEQVLGDRYLPQVMSRAGYRTRGASTNPWVSTSHGFAHGFDTFADLQGGRYRRMEDPGIRSRLSWYKQAFLARVDDGLSAIDAQVEGWLEDSVESPFFWFVNLMECHSPFLPPRPYNELGALDRLRAARDARRYQTQLGIRKCCTTGQLPPRQSLERMRELYRSSVRMMDDWVARLCERLDAAGLLDRTILVLTSDHGENLGEDSLIGHAESMDDRLLRVPLIWSGPLEPDIDAPASLASLPRHVASATGLEDAPWSPADIPDGTPVAQYDTDLDPNDPRIDVVWGWGATEEGFRRLTEACSCAVDDRYKLVVLGGEERLYDREQDPLEQAWIPPEEGPASNVAALRRALAEADDAAWTPEPGMFTSEQADPSETEDLEERMKLLGYM